MKLGGELGNSEVRAETQDVGWGEEGAGTAQHWADEQGPLLQARRSMNSGKTEASTRISLLDIFSSLKKLLKFLIGCTFNGLKYQEGY